MSGALDIFLKNNCLASSGYWSGQNDVGYHQLFREILPAFAVIAQLVERDPSKVDAVGSSPTYRTVCSLWLSRHGRQTGSIPERPSRRTISRRAEQGYTPILNEMEEIWWTNLRRRCRRDTM